MEIRLFKNSDISGVKLLWSEVFGDDERFIDNFFSFSNPEKNTLVIFDGENIIGMINFPEIYAFCDNREYLGIYLFAVCVHPNYRKRGLFSQAMAKIDEIARERSYAFSMLIPANESLFPLYERLLYTNKCECKYPYEATGKIEEFCGDISEIYKQYLDFSKLFPSFVKGEKFFFSVLNDMQKEGYCIGKMDGNYVLYKLENGKTMIYDGGVSQGDIKKYGLYKIYKGDIPCEKMQFNLFFDI